MKKKKWKLYFDFFPDSHGFTADGAFGVIVVDRMSETGGVVAVVAVLEENTDVGILELFVTDGAHGFVDAVFCVEKQTLPFVQFVVFPDNLGIGHDIENDMIQYCIE